MSFIDLLFPREELESLRNTTSTVGTEDRKRKLDVDDGSVVPRKLQKVVPAVQRRTSVPSPNISTSTWSSLPNKSHTDSTKSHHLPRSQSLSQSSPNLSRNNSSSRKSCLPIFIESSLMQTYLQHLHPNDRSRYSLPATINSKVKPQPERRPSCPSASHNSPVLSESNDGACSPASMTSDSSASSPGSDSCPTPTRAMYDQFGSHAFSRIFHGLRCTPHERDLMEDLLDPTKPTFSPETPKLSIAAKSSDTSVGEDLVRRMFPQDVVQILNLPTLQKAEMNKIKKEDPQEQHELFSEPALENHILGLEDPEEQAPVVSTRGIAISLDDFFDLEEASD